MEFFRKYRVIELGVRQDMLELEMIFTFIWVVASFPVVDYFRDSTIMFYYIQVQANYTFNWYQLWVTCFMLWFILGMILYTIFEESILLIYKIKPHWWK